MLLLPLLPGQLSEGMEQRAQGCDLRCDLTRCDLTWPMKMKSRPHASWSHTSSCTRPNPASTCKGQQVHRL
jgi:hypothetical protein